ncbi:MFS transporter [Ventosimonas gracilis]|uniref:MFS transporter n=1 Tax=Ventosimonas gracilis TaxID=1680762 RepID=A0A139SV69_9GAMM|nr:MFS transporter [Ventosimonas gracilis]KXU38485.1 MFS transporter [Ventosimonas gracilis]
MNKSPATLTSLLTLAMGMPMIVFYAIGVLGPQMVADLGIPQEYLGWLTASTFGLAALLSPWAGAWVQRIGSRSGLATLFVLVGLSFALIKLLPGFGGVVVALLFCGAAQALANPATNQAIAQTVPPARKAAVVGFKQSGVQASALIAGLVLPGLATWLDWRGAFAVWVPLAALLAWAATRLIPASASSNAAFKLACPGAWLWMLMAIQLFAGLALSSFITFFGVHAQQLGVSTALVGMMVSGFGVMGIASRVVLTPVSSHMRDETLLLLTLFLCAIVALLVMQLATPDSHWPLWMTALGMGASAVATNAIAMSLLLRDARFGTPARTAGMLSAGFFGGFAIGPPVFGALLALPDGFAGAWLFLIAALAAGSLCSVILYWLRIHDKA